MLIRLLVAGLAAVAALQQTQPTIRSGVELIRLDVSVVDKSGRPVFDLKPDEFVVKIDGQQRKVSFANFYGSEGPPAAAAPATAVASFSTNATSTAGRTVVFVVDLESLHTGNERGVTDTAAKLVDGLGPTDLVGVLPIPGKPTELTSNRDQVKTALTSLRGIAPPNRMRHQLSMSEADGFAKRDQRLMAMVNQRECKPGDLNCPGEVAEDAKLMQFEASRRVSAVLDALNTLNEGLRHIETPRVVILLSAGLPFPEETREKFRDLQRRSAAAGTLTYVVHVEQLDTDASRSRIQTISPMTRADLASGLSNLAGAARGEYYAGVGRADRVFERIQTEISNSYQIGVQSSSADADGRTHKVDVQVTRSGLTVKARKELVVSNAPRTAPTVLEVLAAPTIFSEVPLAASAYITQGEDPPSLKVIVLTQLLGAAVVEPLPTYAVSITNEKREQVFAATSKATLSGAFGVRAVAGVQLNPGTYRLRAAVVDAEGNPGSIELPLNVGLRQAGPFQASDLMLGTFTDQFAPATHLNAGTPITALLELYGTDGRQLDSVGVDLELRKSDGEAIVGRGEATIAETVLQNRRAAAGQVSTAGLEPGLYDVSAIIKNGVVRVGIVSRRIAIGGR